MNEKTKGEIKNGDLFSLSANQIANYSRLVKIVSDVIVNKCLNYRHASSTDPLSYWLTILKYY